MDRFKRDVYRTGWGLCAAATVIGGLAGSAKAGAVDAGPTTMPSVVECGAATGSPKTTTMQVVGTCTVHVMVHAVGPVHSMHGLVVGTAVVHYTRTVTSVSSGSGGEIIMMPPAAPSDQIILPPGSAPGVVKVAAFTPPTAAPGQDASPVSDVDRIVSAEKLLASGSRLDRSQGAKLLLAVKVHPEYRTQVLALLKPHLNDDPDEHQRLQIVQAYAIWATVAQERDLLAVLNYPVAPKNLSGAETCWAAAVEGLVRVRSALVDAAVDRRIDWFCFRVDATRFLRPIADHDGPAQAIAEAVIAKLHDYRSRPQVAARGSIEVMFPTR